MQASGLPSLKELRDDLAIHGDCWRVVFVVFVPSCKAGFENLGVLCTLSFLPSQESFPVLCIISFMVGTPKGGLLIFPW